MTTYGEIQISVLGGVETEAEVPTKSTSNYKDVPQSQMIRLHTEVLEALETIRGC